MKAELSVVYATDRYIRVDYLIGFSLEEYLDGRSSFEENKRGKPDGTFVSIRSMQ
jgi:hypothetical protein